MTRLYNLVRRFNFHSMDTPAILGVGQRLTKTVSVPEAGALARWGLAGGLIVYWMIEDNFETS